MASLINPLLLSLSLSLSFSDLHGCSRSGCQSAGRRGFHKLQAGDEETHLRPGGVGGCKEGRVRKGNRYRYEFYLGMKGVKVCRQVRSR